MACGEHRAKGIPTLCPLPLKAVIGMVRRALVAGLFYAHEPRALRQQLESCFLHRLGPGEIPMLGEEGLRRIVGLVVPHAGYIYSGMTAAKAYASLARDGIPQVAVIFAPAHYRQGEPLAVWTKGAWETPLGSVPIAEEVAQALVVSDGGYAEDFNPHMGGFGRGEHAIEVQLPFLQFIFGDKVPAIVPVAVSSHDLTTLLQGGKVLGETLTDLGSDAVIIASCDLTHYEPHAVAQRHDLEALGRLAALDSEGLWQTVLQHPSQSDALVAIPMIEACRLLGATKGEIIGYSTSGDVTGDLAQVVGYGAVKVSRL